MGLAWAESPKRTPLSLLGMQIGCHFAMTLITLPANNLLINLDNNTILYSSIAFHPGNSKCLASTIKSNAITHR